MIDQILVSSLSRYLDKILPVEWPHFETETILLELGVEANDLLIDKINLIKVFRANDTLFYEDPMFFMYSCEIFNNNVADFDTLPHITSLEAALAIIDASRLLGLDTVEESHRFSEGVRMIVREILVDDGYSFPVWPFDSVGIADLSEGATKEDMANKSRAIREYVASVTGKH